MTSDLTFPTVHLNDYKGQPSIPVALRFWSKVDIAPVEMCWEWLASISKPSPYPRFKLGDKTITAHRAAWTLAYGPIPKRLLVRHKCDNPKCCNPAHLELGTHQDNVNDMMRRGRHTKVSLAGSSNPRAKLDEVTVKAIRAKYATGTTSTIKLAREFAVSQGLISQIVNQRIWRHCL